MATAKPSVVGATLTKLLRDWVQKACEFIAKRGPDNGRPPFSGVISVELEAARNPEQVQRSVNNLQELFLQRDVYDKVTETFSKTNSFTNKVKLWLERIFPSRK
jgi:hypothetical protein